MIKMSMSEYYLQKSFFRVELLNQFVELFNSLSPILFIIEFFFFFKQYLMNR